MHRTGSTVSVIIRTLRLNSEVGHKRVSRRTKSKRERASGFKFHGGREWRRGASTWRPRSARPARARAAGCRGRAYPTLTPNRATRSHPDALARRQVGDRGPTRHARRRRRGPCWHPRGEGIADPPINLSPPSPVPSMTSPVSFRIFRGIRLYSRPAWVSIPLAPNPNPDRPSVTLAMRK